jgi:hypothetical protein
MNVLSVALAFAGSVVLLVAAGVYLGAGGEAGEIVVLELFSIAALAATTSCSAGSKAVPS